MHLTDGLALRAQAICGGSGLRLLRTLRSDLQLHTTLLRDCGEQCKNRLADALLGYPVYLVCSTWTDSPRPFYVSSIIPLST
jgi:hypothetical protein